MALLVTAQGSLPLLFDDSHDVTSADAEGRVDYAIRTDDTSFVSTVEYKVYFKAKTQNAITLLKTVHYAEANSAIKKTNDAWATFASKTYLLEDFDVPTLTLNKDVLVTSGTFTNVATHDTSTGLPYVAIGFQFAFGITGGNYNLTVATPETAAARDSLIEVSAAISPSTISSSAGFLGEPVVINVVHKRSGVYANITYQMGNTTGYVVNGLTASSYNWTIPSELIVEFGETEIQKEIVLTCDSYVEGVLLGTTQAKLTAFLPSDQLTPSLNPTVKDINPDTVALTGNENYFVRYKSIAEYAINAAAVKGATLVKQQVKNGTNVIDNIPSGTIPNVESDTFEFLAIDNRDMGASTTIVTPNFVEYIKLTCNQKIHMEVSGETGATAYVRIFGNYYQGSFGATDNTLKVEIRHTDNDGNMTDWVDITSFSDPDISNGTYDVDFSISNMRYDLTYTFQCRATDKLDTIATSEYILKVMPVFDWSEDDFNFNVPVSVHGSMTFDSNRTITLGDCSIENNGEELTINAETINLNAPNVSFNDVSLMNIDNGTWYPEFASEAAIASYSAAEGWYQKIGNTVTIGFNISAICNAGFTGTSLAITGLPYTPAYTAFGGGVASRVHVAGGNNFQCWAAGTDGQITGRVQACNGTGNGTLSTSASGLFYGASEIAITVGGTITYITND